MCRHSAWRPFWPCRKASPQPTSGLEFCILDSKKDELGVDALGTLIAYVVGRESKSEDLVDPRIKNGSGTKTPRINIILLTNQASPSTSAGV